MDTCALCGSGDVVWCIRWHEYLVDDVDDAVACCHIWESDCCSIDGDCVSNTKRECVAINGGCSATFFNSRRWDFTSNNVVQQDVRECGFALFVVKCSKVDACICKGLIGWGKDSEWAFALEGFKQLCLYDGSDK